MKQNFLETGKIVGTHGIKGMVRIQLWADSQDFLNGFKFIYLDQNGNEKLEILKTAPHGNVCIAAFKGVDSIEAAEKLRNRVIYISRKDVKLPEGRYFIADLLGCRVFDAETDAFLGEICDVSETGANDVWHIKKDGKEYLMPAIDEVLVNVDIDSQTVVIKALKGIFDDEN